jgi:uncharacterized membrane protein YgdD (TMEM256/DUF423 family)
MGSGWFAMGAVTAGLAVALGAFGAHGLKPRITAEHMEIFETAVRYHMYHALALLSVGWGAMRWPGNWVQVAGWAFTFGILVFSGSLYLLSMTGLGWLGAITPVGGVAFLVGWAALAIAALRGVKTFI